MGRVLGSWLEGPAAAGYGPQADACFHPGSRLGLPLAGPGSVAPSGRRFLALFIDLAIAALVGRLVWQAIGGRGELSRTVTADASFVAEYVLLLAAAGQTIGMRLLGLRLVPVGALRLPWVSTVLLRTLLLCLLVPAVITDRDRRGLHDKASQTVLVRA